MKELSRFKLFAHSERLNELLCTGDTHPITIEMDPINVCNHHCKYCADNKAVHSGEELDLRFVERMMPELKAFGARSVIFKGGGEPTLHPELNTFILLASMHGLKTAMLTNGSRLKNNTTLQNTILQNMAYIRISLDAPTSEIHKYWHNTDDYDDIIEGIKQLVELKKESKSKCLIGVNILYDPETLKYIPEGVHLAEKLKIDILSFRRAYTLSYGFVNPWTNEMLYEDEKMRRFIADMKHSLKHIMIDGSRGYDIKGNEEDSLPKCLPIPLFAVICADRGLYPCCDLRLMKEYCMGNLEDHSIQTLWESNCRKEVMKKVISKQCYKMCTHRFAYYNEILNYLVDPDKPHVEII